MEDPWQQTRPKRIFINDVDMYSSKHIATFLSTCVAGQLHGSEHSDEEEETTSPRDGPAFHIVGTLSTSTKDAKEFSFLQEQYRSPTRDELLRSLLECDVVVYNVSEKTTQQQVEEATWAIEALRAEMDNFKSRKMFILISTVMTWAKPQNPDDSVDRRREEEYRSRRPHPNFRGNNALEKLVLKSGKRFKFRSYVVTSGLQYGRGENLFHYFFKASWLMQSPEVPLFGHGKNCIPTIHVYDLGRTLQSIIELKPQQKYILAIDDSTDTLEDIVKMISNTVGPGKMKKLAEQEAVAMEAFEPEELEYLSIDLSLEASIVKDFDFSWTSEEGMVENMETIVEEYKHVRQLLPIRIFLVGPPAVGKSTVAEMLCRHYKIPHIKTGEVIEEKIKRLKEIASGAQPEDVNDEKVAAAKVQLGTINKALEINAGQLDDHVLSDILQEKLNSKPCSNQGYVLEGLPETYEQAKLFFPDDDAENEDLPTPGYNQRITPAHVFALNAPDDVLTARAQALPRSVAWSMGYAKGGFVARLTRYRQLSSAEDTVLHYFHEIEIHPEDIDVAACDSEYTDVVKKIIEIVGTPKNYGLSPEEQEEQDRKEEEERQQKLAAEAAERTRRKVAQLAEMVDEYDEWKRNMSELRRQEHEMLEAHSLPMRNYLMKYVMPTLTQAMSECAMIKPEDPVDFMAEYLLVRCRELA